MAISTDYPRPITVNGYVCRNCDDVSDAKKFIDPSAPKGAEFNARDNSTAVSFGGRLTGRQDVSAPPPTNRLLDRYA